MSNLVEINCKLRCILEKNPHDRSEFEVTLLAQHYGSFFTNYKSILSEEIYLEIFKALRLETFKKFEVVFNYGDIGRKIYYILKGEAYVLVPKIYDVNDHSALTLNNLHKNLLPTTEEQILHEYPSFLIRTVLREGYNFGEVALIIKGCRNSTIVCKEDCELLVMHAETYEKIKKKNQQNVYSEKMEFLTGIPMFNQWRRTNISLVMFYLKDETIGRGHYIYKEFDEISGLYIIFDGEIELFRSVNQKNKAGNFQVTKKRLISVAKLMKGQTFGEEEIFLKSKRIYYARCLSINAKLLLLTKKDLFDNIKSRTYLENMKNDAEKKMEHRETYFQKKIELINQYKNKKPTVKPKDLLTSPRNKRKSESSNEFSSRSNFIQSYVSEAEKHHDNSGYVSEKKNHGLSQLLKHSVIAHMANNIPKYRNKVISLHERKNLEKSYDCELANKIRTLVEKRIEGTLTDRTLTKKDFRKKNVMKRPKTSEVLLQKRKSEEGAINNQKHEVKIKIRSFSRYEKKVDLGPSFKEDVTPKLNDKEFLYNFIVKKKK